MKIIITGALGHIGSRLIRHLPYSFPGIEIIMIDNMMTQRFCSLFDLPKEGNYRFIEADVTRLNFSSLLDEVDVVVHLAAITDATNSFSNADEVEHNNLTSTKLIAEACAKYNVHLISLSSTSVYGSQADIVDEDCGEDELRPQSPYAKTKLKEEQMLQSLVNSQGLQTCIFRFGTIFGTSPGMRFHTAVNKFCWQAVMAIPITVWASAYDQKRPYLDLDDAIKAIEFVIKKDLFNGKIYNVVTKNASVRQVVDYIREHIPSLDVKFVDSPIMNQLSYQVLNKRFAESGFLVSGDFSKGIAKTISLLNKANINIGNKL